MLATGLSLFHNRNLFLLGLSAMGLGLSLSKPLIVIGILIIAAAWLLQGNPRDQIIAFFRNKPALVLCSIYIISLLGLLHTSNMDYALDDLRRKLPLVVLPFLVAGFKKINANEWKLLFLIYLIGVILASLWSMFVYWGGLNIEISDYRELSRFTSHIRFGLEICFAIFGCVYFAYHEKKRWFKYALMVIALGLVSFLFVLHLFTGIIGLCCCTVLFLFITIFRLNVPWLRLLLVFILLLLLALGSMTLHRAVSNYYVTKHETPSLPNITHTTLGEKYQNYTSKRGEAKENGYYVWKNIAEKEIQTAWEQRSDISFGTTDCRQQHIRTTLIRFITSKGQYKDKMAVNQLSDEEVAAIEKGVANSWYLNMNNVSKRIHQIIWEYDRYREGYDYNNHSIIMRWAFWKTGLKIFLKNRWIGVGTGDVNDAFLAQYEEDDSILFEKNRLRAHNQYLTYAITYGIIGLFVFLFCLFYPAWNTKAYNNPLYFLFFSMMLLSMLTEDTLETQVGVTLFAFFNTILLLKEN